MSERPRMSVLRLRQLSDTGGALDDAMPVHVARLPLRREDRENPYDVARAALAARGRLGRGSHQLLELLLAGLAAVRVDRHGRSLT